MKAVGASETSAQARSEQASDLTALHKERLRAAMKILIRHISSDLHSFLDSQAVEDEYAGQTETSVVPPESEPQAADE